MSSISYNDFVLHAEKYWGNRTCPICGNANWEIDPDVATIVRLSNNTMMLGGPVIPLVVVTCVNCGYTFFMNAKIANCLQEKGRTVGGATDGPETR